MTEFVERVRARTGERYHPTTISLLERNQQGWLLKDVRALAAVDPKGRGEIWLSALSDAATWPEHVDTAPELTVSRGSGEDAAPALAPTKTGAPKLPLKRAVHPLDDVKGAAKPRRGRGHR